LYLVISFLNITTVEEEVKFLASRLREITLAKSVEPSPTYESTVIKEADLSAYLKKGWEFAGTL